MLTENNCSRCLGWMGIGYFGYLGSLETRICFDCHQEIKQTGDPLWSLTDVTQQRNRQRHERCALKPGLHLLSSWLDAPNSVLRR